MLSMYPKVEVNKRHLFEPLSSFSVNRWVIALLLFTFSVSCFAQKSEEFIMPGFFRMPDTEVTATAKKSKEKDGVRLDLHRFMGFEEVPVRYLSLPYDTCQHTNVKGSMNDVGFLILLLVPILFLFTGKDKGVSRFLSNLSIIILCVLMLLLSIPSSFLNQNKLRTVTEGRSFLKANPKSGALGKISDFTNEITLSIYEPFQKLFTSVSGTSDAVTYPLLILLFAALTYLTYKRTTAFSKKTGVFTFFTIIYFFLWWILGAGAAWYGFLLFSFPLIFLVKGMSIPHLQVRLKDFSLPAGIFVLSCIVWLSMSYVYRTANYFPVNKERSMHLYIPPFVEYQTKSIKKDILLNSTFPNAVQFDKVINRTDGLVYRVGTQMNFFIEKNDQRVFTDTFLDFFESMIVKFKDKNKIIQALKARGFEYIVFDLNLSMNDQTPEKLLIRKFTNFINTFYQNPGVELLLTDRTIRLKDSGQLIYGIFPERGPIENQGRMAVFRLK